MKNILELLKKNIAIVACLVVAVGAVVANFIPLGGYRDQLKTEAEARKGAYAAIDELITKQRSLPNFDPSSTDAGSLEGFPTRAVIDQVKLVSDEFVKKAGNLMTAAARLNEKQPLEPGALPNPQFVQANAFLLEYKRAVDMSPSGRAQSLPVKLMNAGFAPSNEDIQSRITTERKRVEEAAAIIQNGQIVNQEPVNQAIAAQLEGLQDRIVQEVANNCSVYINAETMDVQAQLLNTNSAPDPSVIFWAQMQLWAQEDLFKAIADANSGAKNVGESPIKHLLRVQVPVTFVGTSATPGVGPEGAAAPPSADPGAPIQPNFAVSPTGRVSNGLYDVLHIDATMVIEAARLPEVLNNLSRGRLLGVIQVKQVEPVDPIAATKAGYYYGPKHCVRVELQFEVLMMRQWTAQYMPERIKTTLGIPMEPVAGGEAPPPPG